MAKTKDNAIVESVKKATRASEAAQLARREADRLKIDADRARTKAIRLEREAADAIEVANNNLKTL